MAIKTKETVEKKSEKKVELKVLEECGVISTRKKRNGEEVVRLDYASWNDGTPKYELRIWSDREGTMTAGKGIGLTGEELIALRDLINKLEEE